MQTALRAGALLGMVLVAMAVPPPTLADGPNRAGLVVQLDSGQVITRCVTFEAEEVRGEEMLIESGLELILDPASSMGTTVCQIEGVGCDFPAEQCFCQCMGGGECTYWNYYYRDPGQAEWVYSAMGAAMREVRPGSVEAWVWGQGQAAPADELSFEAICTPPTAVPTAGPTASSQPPAPSAMAATAPDATASVTQPPPAKPSATAPLPTPPPAAAANAGQTLLGYWPFGLMLLGLGLVGLILWRRRA